MHLAEVILELQQKFPTGPVCNIRFAPTGEEFVTVVSGGVKAEGQVVPILCSTPELAVRFWRNAVMDYVKDKKGTMYWRAFPQIETHVEKSATDLVEDRTWYTVYSRLLVSDAPWTRKVA